MQCTTFIATHTIPQLLARLVNCAVLYVYEMRLVKCGARVGPAYIYPHTGALSCAATASFSTILAKGSSRKKLAKEPMYLHEGLRFHGWNFWA